MRYLPYYLFGGAGANLGEILFPISPAGHAVVAVGQFATGIILILLLRRDS